MRGGHWWSRSRGLPPQTYERWRTSVLARAGTPARVLAWARTPDGFCIGSPAVLSYGSDDFSHVGWHEIEHGGWNAETRRLGWVRYDTGDARRRGVVELTEPGRLPELFRERVAATIVLERFVPLEPGAEAGPGVMVSGRRDLAGPADLIEWHADPVRGTSWQTPGARELAEDALNRLRTEYGTR